MNESQYMRANNRAFIINVLINAAAISKMKKGVIILNLSRDILCNEVDVLAGINSGKIRKYVTDFPNPTTSGHD